MKRPETVCDSARDEYSQLTFFVKYTESVLTIFKPIKRQTPTLFKCYSLIFDEHVACHILKFSITVAESCEQCRL